MSSKEAKNLLKEAREAIKSKEYPVAIKKCKEALTHDKKNGMAFVLMGAAYQESDKSEAAKCLRKAIELSEDCKLIALQGLANCAPSKELPEIYEELIKLSPEKYMDYYAKLGSLVMQDLITDHSQLIRLFCAEIKVDNEERKFAALKTLLNVFMKNRDEAFEKHRDDFLECLEIGIKDVNHLYHIDIYQFYFKILHQKNRLSDLVKAAEDMTTIYSNNIVPLEWICKVYIESQDTDFKISENLKANFGIYVEKLLEINPNSVLGLTASALAKYTIGDLTGSRDILIKVNELQPNWSVCLKKLALIHERFRAHLLAELIYRQLKGMEVNLAHMLIEQQVKEKVLEGLKICKSLKSQFVDELIIKGYIYLERFDEAEDFLKKTKGQGENYELLNAILYHRKSELEKAVDVLKDVESHEAFLEVGRALFELKKFEDSLINILKATKLDPNNSECFYWLGKIYMTINDEARSKKCFEKCLNLNPQNEKAIAILSAIYRKNKDWEQNLQILENSVKSVDGAYQKAAFFQLGLHHLAQQSYDNAITSFRNSLKYDKENTECWEALADAYLARGSFNSALNVFEKSVELNPNNNYAKLQIAKIKFILQQYQESVADYEELLALIPDYLPALKGIAESNMGRAYYLHENHRTGRARDHCQNSLSFLERAIRQEPNFICLWRTLGNIFDFVGSFPEVYNHLIVPAAIVCENSDKKLCGDELLDLASKCYSRCLKIDMKNDFVWFDLVTNYYKRAMKLKKEEMKMEFLKLAYDGAKHLVKLAPTKWQNWNILGIVSSTKEINDPALAQHCFIKAVNLDKKTFTSWSNLGVFYLIQGDIKLANKAFSRAQQSDTSFLNAWIGQAWVAELIGENDEAMDLFRHCTQLGFHDESALGYSNFVCSVLNNPDYASNPKYEYAIDKMHAIPLALDNINWHCLNESDATFEAWCFIGYLSKCQKLYSQSSYAYEKAVKLAEDVTQKDKCLTDLGFCYLKMNMNSKAASTFSDVKEATFISTIGLALAFYKDGQYQECYETYQKAIEWLSTNDEEKAQVLIAMAAMIYAFQGAEDAKMVLFQCIGLSPTPVEGLLSLCAISLLHKDKQLGELVMKELKNYEKDLKYGHHVSFMMAQFYIEYESKEVAIAYISSRIHEFPDRPFLRKVLANVLLETSKCDKQLMKAACRMAESSLVLRIMNKEVMTSQEAAEILAVASLTMKSVDVNISKMYAQKAIHICPSFWKMLKIQ